MTLVLGGERSQAPIEPPTEDPLKWTCRTRISHAGVVMAAGGRDGYVELKLERGPTVRATPGTDMARDLAKLLYRRVRFDFDAQVGLIDRAFKEIEIIRYSAVDARPTAQVALAALHEERKSWTPINTKQFMADRDDED